MEDRSSWLPPGVEGPGDEPDDRAAQRSERRGGKSDSGPAPAGGQRPINREKEQAPATSDPEKPPPKPDPSQRKPPKAEDRDRSDWHREDGDRSDWHREEDGDEPRADRGREDGDEPRDGGEPSDVDAMGQEKHRKVVGQRYGLSRGRQLLYYGIFIVFVIVAYIGLKAAVAQLDTAPAHDPDQAPWSKPGAPQGPLGGFEPSEQNREGPTRFQ